MRLRIRPRRPVPAGAQVLLLATVALAAAVEPKLPPYVGD